MYGINIIHCGDHVEFVVVPENQGAIAFPFSNDRGWLQKEVDRMNGKEE